jgi:hypothetical protein
VLTPTPSSPAYSSCHTHYHTRRRRPLRNPPHRRRSRRVSLAIVLVKSYCTTSRRLCHSESYANNVTKVASILVVPYSQSYLPPANCSTTSLSISNSLCLTSYRTCQWRPLCHPAHRRRSRRVYLAIVLITSYYIPSISVTLSGLLTTTPSLPAYSSRLTRYHTPYRRTVRQLPHRNRTRRVLLGVVIAGGCLYATLLIDVVVVVSHSQLYSSRCIVQLAAVSITLR